MSALDCEFVFKNFLQIFFEIVDSCFFSFFIELFINTRMFLHFQNLTSHSFLNGNATRCLVNFKLKNGKIFKSSVEVLRVNLK